MTNCTECLSLPLHPTGKPAGSWLKRLVGGLFSRDGRRATRIYPDDLSRYLLKDIGLDNRREPTEHSPMGRSLMDWPVR